MLSSRAEVLLASFLLQIDSISVSLQPLVQDTSTKPLLCYISSPAFISFSLFQNVVTNKYSAIEQHLKHAESRVEIDAE